MTREREFDVVVAGTIRQETILADKESGSTSGLLLRGWTFNDRLKSKGFLIVLRH